MSSRIVVKGLPKYINEERLKKHFSTQGQGQGGAGAVVGAGCGVKITDLKIVKTRDGKSRRFAYIGFKSDQDGLNAVKYFNNSFLDTCKLQVEIAKSFGDETISRPWSKYSVGSSAHQQKLAEMEKENVEPSVEPLSSKQKKFLDDLDSDDESFKEFLEVMRPRQAASSRTWGNDDITAVKGKEKQTININDDLYQDLPSTYHGEEDEEDEPLQDDAASVNSEPRTESGAETSNSIAFQSTLSDMDYMKLKMKESLEKELREQEKLAVPVETVKVNPGRLAILQEAGAVDKAVINTYQKQHQETEPETTNPVDAPEPVEIIPNIHEAKYTETPSPELIADTGRIMVRNLAYSCTYEDLEERFKKFGKIAELHLPIDKTTKESKGYAFILYVLPEDAFKAFNALDKSIFQGRIMEVVAAKEKPKTAEEVNAEREPETFKSKKEMDLKSKASSDFNWNSLFMNSDAVAEAMARNLGVRKSEILDANSDNMAVRLALAETNIITETKNYLEECGVSLEEFTKNKSKSPFIILVKNIPGSTEEKDLIDLFSPFGTLGRVVLPPARTIAIIEYPDRNEAKAAFRKVAYTNFKGVPLYLQWAPTGTFIADFDPEKKLENTKKVS